MDLLQLQTGDQYRHRKERAGARPPRKFKAPVPVRKWTITYRCHRAGKPHSVATKRNIYKKSKHIGCEATLKVEYRYSDPYNVLLTLCGTHNHELVTMKMFALFPSVKTFAEG